MTGKLFHTVFKILMIKIAPMTCFLGFKSPLSILTSRTENQLSITSGQGWLGPMLCTVKWGKKVLCSRVFDLAVEQPQLFRKLPKNKQNKNVNLQKLAQCYIDNCKKYKCLREIWVISSFSSNGYHRREGGGYTVFISFLFFN